MPARTEDLLSLRDGEPMDAALRARLEADPAYMAEVKRLRDVRDALRALPRIAPPARAWERVAAGDVPVTRRAPAHRGRLIGAAAAGLAAVLVLSTLVDDGAVRRAEDSQTSADVSLQPSGPDLLPDPGMVDDAPAPIADEPPYAALLRESARLERLLETAPRQRPIMNAGTAGTIAALEDRVGYIDGQLTIGAAQGLEPDQRLALWRERIDVMNALVALRYAHARPAFYPNVY